jgi:hypothetical protein
MPPVTGVVLYNQYGLLDLSRPFQPFGVQPTQGSYVLVGSPEFLIQRPESVRLRIEWENLPSSFDFARYYESYGVPVENSSFQVGASFLSGGQWHPLDLPDPSLFRTIPGDPSLVSEFVLEPPPASAAPPPEVTGRLLEYDRNTTDGFFRLELTAPAFGFGAALYANALSSVILKNASSGEKLPLPNAPLTPLASGISFFSNPTKIFRVNDAGLVITWPFLQTLFERTGVASDRLRTVSLLLYLAWGRAYQEHQASSLIKILAGLPPESDVPPPVPLTKEETGLCDSLLSALTARWEIIKNTSIEGIRGSFLQRNGRLVKDQDQYVLTVEGKTFDLLLDQLPWSYSLVKTPWMDRALSIRWR